MTNCADGISPSSLGELYRQRMFAVVGKLGGAFRLNVTPGADLLQSVESWAAERDCLTVAFRLLSGSTAALRVMTGGPDRSGARTATFYGPHQIDCPACVLGGHGVVGAGPHKLVPHAHAVFIDLHGRARGCHLIRGHCLAASDGIQVAVFPVEGAVFQVSRDPETMFELFFPRTTA